MRPTLSDSHFVFVVDELFRLEDFKREDADDGDGEIAQARRGTEVSDDFGDLLAHALVESCMNQQKPGKDSSANLAKLCRW